jgi:hypothetical protein
MKYEVGQIYQIALDDLIVARWNPPIRADRIRNLVDSIRENGQLVPILVTADLRVSDGHRRIAALREIGIPFAAALIIDGSQKESYAIVNSTQRPLGAREAMQAYVLGGPKAGSEATQRQMDRLEAAMGKPGMGRAAQKGFGPGVDRIVRWVITACGQDPENIGHYRLALNYILDHPGSANYLRAVQDGHIHPKPIAIWRAIKTNQSLPRRSSQQRRALKSA